MESLSSDIPQNYPPLTLLPFLLHFLLMKCEYITHTWNSISFLAAFSRSLTFLQNRKAGLLTTRVPIVQLF